MCKPLWWTRSETRRRTSLEHLEVLRAPAVHGVSSIGTANLTGAGRPGANGTENLPLRKDYPCVWDEILDLRLCDLRFEVRPSVTLRQNPRTPIQNPSDTALTGQHNSGAK